MSFQINQELLTDVQIKKIGRVLEVEIKNRYKTHFAKKEYSILYEVENDTVKLPFHYAFNMLGEKPNRDIKFDTIDVKFNGKLREHQIDPRNQVLNLLNSDGSVLLAGYPGFGKTATSCYFIAKIKLITVVLSHRQVIMDQWVSSYKKFTNSDRIKIIGAKDTDFSGIDVFIINPDNVPRMKNFPFHKVGFLICDEAHACCSDKRSKVFHYFTPKFCLALTASPKSRKDGLDVTLVHFFGKQIMVPFFQVHDVYRVETEFIPEFTVNADGKTDWGSVLKSQCEDEERNEKIIDICKFFPDRTIFVLCKRKEQTKYLLKRLQEDGEDVDIYIASQKIVNYNCRILLSTFSKSGVGFDHPGLNMLILASDVESLIDQYIGRVFRGSTTLQEGQVVYIIDLVDNFKLLENHWNTRRRYYKKIGGRIKKFSDHFDLDEEFIVV